MNIETLTYIHELMKKEVVTRLNARNYIANLASKAEEENASNAQTLRNQHTVAIQKHFDAVNALEDFEAKEW